MKKFKFLPVLLLAGLLASCGSNISDKEPTFKAEGEKVTYETFVQKLEEAYENSEIEKTDVTLKDRVLESRDVEMSTRTLSRGGKELSKNVDKVLTKSDLSFDQENKVGKRTYAAVVSSSTNSKTTNGSSKSDGEVTMYYQAGTVEESKYVLQVCENDKTYTPASPIGEDTKYFDTFVRSCLEALAMQYFLGNLPLDPASAADYSFYINNNNTLFTFEYSKENTNDNEDYTRVVKTTLKTQLDITDGAQFIAYKETSDTTTTYKEPYANYAKGDVLNQSTVQYFEGKSTSKNVDLKAVDLNDYALVGYMPF